MVCDVEGPRILLIQETSDNVRKRKVILTSIFQPALLTCPAGDGQALEMSMCDANLCYVNGTELCTLQT